MDDLAKMLNMINDTSVTPVNDKMGYSACAISRLLNKFFHCKFLNFHGQQGVRLSRDHAVHGHPNRRSSLIMDILSPLLFYSPDSYFESLQNMYVDATVTLTPWCGFLVKLSDEWKEITLYGTVILNANVAFLAIQSIDNDCDSRYRSPAQIASYLSLVTSAGSVTLGLLLNRQHRSRNRSTPADAAAFLNKMDHPTRGLTVLAIMYSLPYALLMWGIVCFLSAFSLMCLEHTNIVTRCGVGVAILLVLFLVVWCVQTAWEGEESFLRNWARKFLKLNDGRRLSSWTSDAVNAIRTNWMLLLGLFRRRFNSTDSALVGASVTV